MRAATIAEDSMARWVLEELPKVLDKHPSSLLCDERRPIPGLPCFRPEYDYGSSDYLSPWGKVERLYGQRGLGTRHLYRFNFYRLCELNPEAPRPRMPQKGHAEIDPITEIATVYAENGGDPMSVYHTRISLDDRDGHDVLKRIRVELAKASIPVYPRALYGRPSLPYPWKEGRTFRVPRVMNDEVAVPLVGCVLDPDNQAVTYLHMVGSKTACRSIWGTLNTSGMRTVSVVLGERRHVGYSYSQEFDTYSAPLDADTNLYRLMVTDQRATDREVEGRAYLIIPKADCALHLGRVFAARLNALLPVPVLPEWGEVLLDHGLDEELLKPCLYGGDVAQAYAIGRQGWVESINQLVQGGELAIE